MSKIRRRRRRCSWTVRSYRKTVGKGVSEAQEESFGRKLNGEVGEHGRIEKDMPGVYSLI
jgi:hypothetical protein